MFFPLNWSRALSMGPRDQSYTPGSDRLVTGHKEIYFASSLFPLLSDGAWPPISCTVVGFQSVYGGPRGPGTSFLWPLKGTVCAYVLCTVSLGDETDR